MKNHLKLKLLYLLIFIITLYGCGTDTTISSQSSDKNNEYGNATFGLKWESPQISHDMSLRALSLPKGEAISELSYAPIDCTAIGVSTVNANVYDSGGTYITSGGPWNCADHSGTITGISAGINRMITINGKDSSSRIIYNGQITGVTIDKDQTTNAGQITMSYVANDTTAPTDGTLSASAGNSQVSLSWSGWTDSGSGIGSYKLVYSTTTTPSSCSSGTQIWTGTGTSYTHTGLTNNTTYYYRVCATDNAGNTSNGATASGIPSSTGTTTTTTTTTTGGTTTTGSVPSAPTGVSATAGNTQATISWSSVSGATSYNIYWLTTSGVTKTTGTKVTGATSPYTHTGLTNSTTYYYVVTAVNSYGESSESSQVSATPVSGTTTVTDIDGNVYNTVTIGTQVWMQENLKVTKYRNGDAIGTTTANISAETSPKYQWAYANESNVATYGRLYTWYAVADSRGVCPTGWHLPTDSEWTTLTDYLGGTSVAGGKMKEAGTTHWNSPNTGADNSSGWTALPGGFRSNIGSFYYIGNNGHWWSATENGTTYVWDRHLYYSYGDATRVYDSKDVGFSVRCVRD